MKTLARVVLIGIVAIAAVTAGAQDALATNAKDAKARELLVLMNVDDTALQMVDGMLASMKQASPTIPDDFWTAFRAEIKPDEFLDLLVPIYAENFDEADLDGLLTFYRSPLGKRFIDRQSAVLQQSMAAGQKWGEQLALRAMERMKAKTEG